MTKAKLTNALNEDDLAWKTTQIGMARIPRKEDKANCLSLGELCSSKLVPISNQFVIFFPALAVVSFLIHGCCQEQRPPAVVNTK